MEILEVSDLRMQYRSLCEYLVSAGSEVEPRGRPTHELTDVAIVLPGPEAATFPTKIGRKASPAILAAELMQWIAGVSDLQQLNSVSADRFKNYSDNGATLYGAYGPRAYRGLARAVRVLQQDTLSRQASVSLWRSLESTETADLPCTLSWSFKIRNDALEMMTVMRSNDVWTGVAYDIPSMARIQSALAWALDVEPGRYTHVAQSLHIYASDVAKIARLHETSMPLEDDDARAPLLAPVDEDVPKVPTERWEILRDHWARAAMHSALIPTRLPREFQWYARQLEEHVGYDYFCDSCRYYLPQPELICQSHITLVAP